MQIRICNDYEEMSVVAAELAAECAREAPEGLFSFPAGDTPIGMVQRFVEMVNDGGVDISRAGYVSLDEWVGLGAEEEGSCAYFNRKYLLKPLNKHFARVYIIDGAAPDMEAERKALEDHLLDCGPLSLSVLGIGLNGHLGFNEDGVDFEQDAILTPLSVTTKRVMAKYFGKSQNPEYGISIGIRQLMAAKAVVLMANGEKKAGIIAQMVNGPVTNAVPASVLQTHPNCTLVLDKAAAAKL